MRRSVRAKKAGFRRRLVGLGYWLRYARPTHAPHADLEKVAVEGAVTVVVSVGR